MLWPIFDIIMRKWQIYTIPTAWATFEFERADSFTTRYFRESLFRFPFSTGGSSNIIINRVCYYILAEAIEWLMLIEKRLGFFLKFITAATVTAATITSSHSRKLPRGSFDELRDLWERKVSCQCSQCFPQNSYLMNLSAICYRNWIDAQNHYITPFLSNPTIFHHPRLQSLQFESASRWLQSQTQLRRLCW